MEKGSDEKREKGNKERRETGEHEEALGEKGRGATKRQGRKEPKPEQYEAKVNNDKDLAEANKYKRPRPKQ